MFSLPGGIHSLEASMKGYGGDWPAIHQTLFLFFSWPFEEITFPRPHHIGVAV